MFIQTLFGFGIRGYVHYDWKPRPKERLICRCPADCVIVQKRVGKEMKQVGTVPTEIQTVFREFLIHGGRIEVTCTSDTYRRAPQKGKEIVVVYNLKGSEKHSPLMVSLKELKAVVDELRVNDPKIELAPIQVVKKKPSPSKSSSRKGDFASSSQQKLPKSQSSSRKKKASTKEISDPEESLEDSEGEHVKQKTRREIKKNNAKGADTRSDSEGNDEELTVKNRNQRKKVKIPTGNRNIVLVTGDTEETQRKGKCRNKNKHKHQNPVEENEDETGDEGSGEDGIKSNVTMSEPEETTESGFGSDKIRRKIKRKTANNASEGEESGGAGDVECELREVKQKKIQKGTHKQKVTSKVGGYGGKTKLGGRVFPNHHRFSMGHLFTKPIDDSMCESLVKSLPVEMKSVGLLIYRKELGTVFRVGRSYLMTACHVVKDIVDPQRTGNPDFSRLADREVYVTFSESACERNSKEYHLRAFIRYGIQYDFAVLEISDPDENLPKALQLDYRDTSNLSRVWITGYGHKSSKKTLDPSCQIITPTSKIISDAISSFEENKTDYRNALIKNGRDPTFADELIEYGFNGYKNPERLLLHSVLQHGGSGSPVFASEDSRTLKVIGIFTGGLPEFYFYLPETHKMKYNGQHRFEIALKMCYVHENIEAEDPELASDIFSL